MRLIDADEHEKEIYKWMSKVQEIWMDSEIPPIENIIVSIMMTIQAEPTVEAIPIDFLKEKIAECVQMRDSVGDNVAAYERWDNEAWCLTELLESWKKNQ